MDQGKHKEKQGKVNTALGVGVFEQKKDGAKVEECYQLEFVFLG